MDEILLTNLIMLYKQSILDEDTRFGVYIGLFSVFDRKYPGIVNKLNITDNLFNEAKEFYLKTGNNHHSYEL